MDVKLNLKPLEKIIKALKIDAIPSVSVGIPSSNASRGMGGSDNVTIGMIHEYGTSSIPQRSFLREPLNTQLRRKIDSSRQFGKRAVDEVIATQSLVPWAEKIADIALETVHEGFDTGGFGKWQPDKVPDHQTLVETGQLRDSIVAMVV